MNICGIEITGTQWAAIGSFAFAIASEVIGRSKLKENSVVDVAMSLLGQRVASIRPADTPKISQTQSRPKASSAKRPTTTRQSSSKPSSSTSRSRA